MVWQFVKSKLWGDLVTSPPPTFNRFWYENGEDANAGGALTFAQLQEIRKASLSRTICDNLDDIDVLQPYVFLMQDEFSNRRVSCRDGSIPRWVVDTPAVINLSSDAYVYPFSG